MKKAAEKEAEAAAGSVQSPVYIRRRRRSSSSGGGGGGVASTDEDFATKASITNPADGRGLSTEEEEEDGGGDCGERGVVRNIYPSKIFIIYFIKMHEFYYYFSLIFN
jgi:carbamoylphosphate synthase large subunit